MMKVNSGYASRNSSMVPMRFLRRSPSALAKLRRRSLARSGVGKTASKTALIELMLATDQALVGGVEKQRHKLLGKIKAVIKQEHQQTVGQIVLKSVAAADLALAEALRAHGFGLALLLEL